MTRYPCPICNKRACDSNQFLEISKLSESNEGNADVIIKCRNCKNTLAVKVNRIPFVLQTSPGSEAKT